MRTRFRRCPIIVLTILLFVVNASAQKPAELKRFTPNFEVRALAFSPDGQTFISGGDRLILWDVTTGREVRRIDKEASGAVFLPNGLQFISVHDNDVHVWEVETGRDLRSMEAENLIVSMSVSPDGLRLLTYSWRLGGGMLMTTAVNGAVQVWELNTKRELAKVHENNVLAGAFLPNGTAVYAKVDDGKMASRDLQTKQPVVTFAADAAFSDAFFRFGRDRDYMFFSPTGRRAVSAHKKSLRVWDLENGKFLREIPTTREWEVEAKDGGSNVAFSRDGRFIAWAARDSTVVRLVNIETGQELRQFPHEKNVRAVAFSPDGRHLVSGGEDKVVRLWDISEFGSITGITPPAPSTAPSTAPVSSAAPPVSPAASTSVASSTATPPARAPGGVPRLSHKVAIEAASGTSILRGGEEFKIRVQVANAGTAAASEVRVRIAGDPTVLSAIVPQQTISTINAGQNQTVEFAGILPFDTAARNVEIEVSLALGNAILPDVQVVGFGLARGEVRRTRTVLSEVIDVDDVPDAISLPDRSSSIAIVIGLSSYRESAIPKIPFAGRDAEIMARYLENVAGIPRQNIRMLLGDRATRTDMEEALEEWLPRRVTENSTVIVYYAGHGALDPSTGEAYLVPYEGHPDSPATRLYSLKRLYEKLESLKARDVAVFLDSCFSGSGGRSVAVAGRPLLVSGPNLETQSAKLSILAAAQGNQVSSDLERARHGLFTYFLLKGIRGEADTNNDSWVDLQELFTFTRTNVQSTAISELNREQVPALNGGRDVQQRATNLKLFSRGSRN